MIQGQLASCPDVAQVQRSADFGFGLLEQLQQRAARTRSIPIGIQPENQFPQRNIGSPSATPKTIEAVNSDAEFLHLPYCLAREPELAGRLNTQVDQPLCDSKVDWGIRLAEGHG